MKNYLATTIFTLTSLFLCAFAGHAATITVNTLTDENNTNNAACSLREAINNANGNNTTNGLGCVAGSGTDDIVFSVSGTINLTAVLPEISSSMNIGNNTTTAPNLTVNRSSGGNYRIFLVNSGNTVAMNGLIINNGFAFEANGGGLTNNGTLTITNCIISNNQSSNDGGGILNNSVMAISNSTISNNTTLNFYGGGIEHSGTSLNISGSTFTGNSAPSFTGGGAIDIFGSNTTITNSTFTGNTAYGGGAINAAANATITNCTFSGNSNAAVFAYNSAVVDITNSTFTKNLSGGISIGAATVNLKNTIVAGNTLVDGVTPFDISGTVSASSPNNLIGTGGAGGLTNGVNGNQTNVTFANVRLLPLGNYGGAVQTMPIRPNSPARNAGTNTGAPTTDARGFNRPQATTTDIGAFEIQTNSIVTNTNNSGAGSLRQAVLSVTSGDIIQFETPLFDTAQTISLSAGQIVVGKNLTIYGNGANILNVQNTAAQSSTSSVFVFSNGFTVNINGLTISGGNTTGIGGGLYSGVGNTTTITNCHITGNTAGIAGGGISGGTGNLSLIGTTVSNNTVTGTTSNVGGGLDVGGVITLINSTISGNTVGNSNLSGGGIWTSGTMTITNSTITNNSLSSGSGGSGIRSSGTVTVRNSIIAANQNNATVPDVSGAFTSGGFNLVGNRGTVTGFNQSTDQTGTNPLFENSDGKSLAPTAVLSPELLPLAMNGGTVPTHALINGSRAIDKGNSFGSTTDSRGLIRPVDSPLIANATGGDGADIGAFEAQAPTSASVSISGQVFTTDGRGLRNALITITNNQGNSITVKTSPFGFYRFDEIPVGENYVIEVRSKNFQFSPQIVSVSEDLTELDFYAVGELIRGK